MKLICLNSVILLTFLMGIPPVFSTPLVNMQDVFSPPNDSISVRIGSVRRLRSGDEFGVPKGRFRAKITHQRGLCEDIFKSQRKGTIKRKLDFKIGDKIHYKSKWIEKPLIVTNHLDSKDSTSLKSRIEVSLNQDNSTGYVVGELNGLFSTFKNTEILIYANGVFIGHPDLLGRYAVPTDENGKVSLVVDIDMNQIRKRADSIALEEDNCLEGICNSLTFLERFNNDCCNTTITSVDIDTGNDKRARIDIVYDDDQKKRMLLNKLNLMSLYDSLR